MKYVALLRGINVGGNSIIKMVDLKAAFEKAGFKNVATFIQSGNVVFESTSGNAGSITKKLENSLSKRFKLNLRLIVRSHDQLKNILKKVPKTWIKGEDLRRYIAFIKETVTTKDVLKEVELNEGIDFVHPGQGVVYMSTKMSGLTKSRFTKLAAKKIYKDITIRNYNTTQKILALMEK